MLSSKIKKPLLVILVLGQLVLAPGLAFALPDPGVLSPIPVNDGGSAAQNAAFDVLFQPIVGVNTGCASAEATYEKANSLKQSFNWGSIIGGSDALVGQLAIQLNTYNGFQACRQGVLTSLDALPAPNTYSWNKKQALITVANAALQTYKTKAEQTNARLANAEQGFWKTLTFNILIKVSKSVADALVTKLVSNYKIANLKQYADSVATLMYDNQFIRQNFPEAQGQFMARAIIENPEFRYKIQPGVFTAADQALGFNPKAFNPNDPNFYTNMAAAGSSAANPYYQQGVLVGGLDQSRAASLTAAQAHVAQSSGFKTPVNCLGSLSQQQAIDAQSSAAIAKMADRTNLLNNLQAARQAGKTVSDADIQKAQADAQAAEDAWNKLPNQVGAKDPAIVMCEAIVSPATLINQGIDAVFKNFAGQMTQYNDNNLPSFVSLIGNVASQIGSSFIFGGSISAKNAALINEGQVVNSAVGFANQAIYAQIASNLAKGVQFDAPVANTGVPNSYTITWQVITDTIPSASFVTLSGDGISPTVTDPKTRLLVPNKLQLAQSQQITTTKGGDYVLTVYDATGKVITTATITLDLASLNSSGGSSPATPPSNPPATNVCTLTDSQIQICSQQGLTQAQCKAQYCTGTVSGAFTSVPSLQTRGPETALFIR